MRIIFPISHTKKGNPELDILRNSTKQLENGGAPIHFHIPLSFGFIHSHLPLPFEILIMI